MMMVIIETTVKNNKINTLEMFMDNIVKRIFYTENKKIKLLHQLYFFNFNINIQISSMLYKKKLVDTLMYMKNTNKNSVCFSYKSDGSHIPLIINKNILHNIINIIQRNKYHKLSF